MANVSWMQAWNEPNAAWLREIGAQGCIFKSNAPGQNLNFHEPVGPLRMDCTWIIFFVNQYLNQKRKAFGTERSQSFQAFGHVPFLFLTHSLTFAQTKIEKLPELDQTKMYLWWSKGERICLNLKVTHSTPLVYIVIISFTVTQAMYCVLLLKPALAVQSRTVSLEGHPPCENFFRNDKSEFSTGSLPLHCHDNVT